MKLQLLPTTFDQNGHSTQQQHLCCLVINDCVAIDAGSLAMSTTSKQKESIRDIILSHAHLDHIAGLPIFIDDLFAILESPIRIHASKDVIEALETNIFNWVIYPRFSELKNNYGEVICYQPIQNLTPFQIKGLTFKAVEVNHKVPTIGFIVSDDKSKIAISSDTSEMIQFWDVVNAEENITALFIECAFPNELATLAHSSHHLTPKLVGDELKKFNHQDCPVFAINIKPMYREQVISELKQLKVPKLEILEVGKTYEF